MQVAQPTKGRLHFPIKMGEERVFTVYKKKRYVRSDVRKVARAIFKQMGRFP